jgi:hypothetical protein
VIKTRPLLPYFIAALLAAAVAHAEGAKKNPSSKLYVADTNGDTQIDTGTEIDDLTTKSVYTAEGTTIESKANSNASVVLSNGTGIYFDVNTRVVIKNFVQEAFRPNRSDVEDEPSLSDTKLIIDHGVIGVSTSKLVAGSTMIYETSLATAFIRGRQAVILAEDNLTVISMVQGEATVQAGPLDMPRLIKNHQQIIIHPGNPGEANIVQVQDIPDGTSEDSEQWLEERVLTADAARKLVYFETQARSGSDDSITLFDGSGDAAGGGNREIVPVPVVPANPTVQPNVSPANLTSR